MPKALMTDDHTTRDVLSFDAPDPSRVGVRMDLPPAIQWLVEDAANGLKYSFVTAASRQDVAFPASSVEEAFRQAIVLRKPEVREQYRKKAQQMADAPLKQRQATFGRYAKLSVQDHGAKGFASVVVSPAGAPVKGSMLINPAMLSAAGEQPIQGAVAPEKPKIVLKLERVSGLRFFITSVKCNDETDGLFGSELGDDEILMGGLAVAEGSTKKVAPFLIGSEFDDGETVTFDKPGREFCSFGVPKGGHYPRLYAAVVTLAEEDWGGFASALNKAYEAAFPTIKNMYEKAIGVVLESTTPLPGEVAAKISAIYVEVVGYVVELVVSFILGIFADDVFKPGFIVAKLHTPLALSYSKENGWKDYCSPVKTLTFVGHGGKYTVQGYWRVDRELIV